MAAIGLMSQQDRDLLKCVPLCRLSSVKELRDDRMFLCLISDPALDGGAHSPARFGRPSIGQPHMASRDHHLLDVACRVGVFPHFIVSWAAGPDSGVQTVRLVEGVPPLD